MIRNHYLDSVLSMITVISDNRKQQFIEEMKIFLFSELSDVYIFD